MASAVVFSFHPPTVVRASAASGSEGHVRTHRGGGGGKWWAPIFGWPSDPHYIGGGSGKTEEEHDEVTHRARRFSALTEEKARELRMRMMETETFHDAMYHSAIASRLASDHPRRSGL
ncbi:uncharacterized protein [Typha latifolia]|uniref:uncharacterized protein n=1 Tax=Typha latifolia TaxID=4733 RepID=UPI003C2C3DC0